MALLANDRRVDFKFQSGGTRSYSPEELWYDSDGLVHYIQIHDSDGKVQLYSLMTKETEIHKRKEMFVNLAKIATIAIGAYKIFEDYERGKLNASALIKHSLTTVSNLHRNSDKSEKLSAFLFGGTEEDYEFEYYNVDTGHIWHDDKIFIIIDLHDQLRFSNLLES